MHLTTAIRTLAVLLVMVGCRSTPQQGQEEVDVLQSQLFKFTTFGINLHADSLQALKNHGDLIWQQYKRPEANIISKVCQGLIIPGLPDDRTEGISLFLQALEIAEDAGLPLYQGILYELLGKDYAMIGKHEDAATLYRRAITLFENSYQNRLAHLYNFLAMELTHLDRMDSVLHYHYKAKAIFEKNKDYRSIIATNEPIGFILHQNGAIDEEMAVAKESVALSKNLDEVWQSIALQTLGQMYNANGSHEEALEALLKAVSITERINSINVHFNRVMIAETYYTLKQYQASLQYTNKELAIIEHTQYPFANEHKAKLLKLKANNFEQLSDYDSAYRYYVAYDQLEVQNAEIRKQNESTREASRVAIYEIGRNLKRNEQELNKKSALFNYSLVSLTILLGMLGLVYTFYRQKKQAVEEVETKSLVIKKSLEERDALLKEIHHRVKNNLQIIASLLHLQSGQVQDINSRKTLEEGQGRVRSMALIHQKLYENEDLKHLPFAEYLQELIDEIKASFGKTVTNVAVSIRAENVYFDVETAIPLGLIVNELVTNAFKHAFQNQPGDQCEVSLILDTDHYVLSVADNGKGMSSNIDPYNSASLGLRLVKMLCIQLEGELEFLVDNGTTFKLKLTR